MQHQPDAAASMVMLLIFFFGILVSVALGILLTVLPFWKICTKAGFPGALSLLMLVPIGNFILLFYLAFADWPALRRQPPPPGTP